MTKKRITQMEVIKSFRRRMPPVGRIIRSTKNKPLKKLNWMREFAEYEEEFSGKPESFPQFEEK